MLEQHLTTNPAVLVRRPEVDPDASTTLGLTAEHARALLAGAAEHSPRPWSRYCSSTACGSARPSAWTSPTSKVSTAATAWSTCAARAAAPPAPRCPRLDRHASYTLAAHLSD